MFLERMSISFFPPGPNEIPTKSKRGQRGESSFGVEQAEARGIVLMAVKRGDHSGRVR